VSVAVVVATALGLHLLGFGPWAGEPAANLIEYGAVVGIVGLCNLLDPPRVVADPGATMRLSFVGELSALIFFYMHGAATRPLPTETAFAARRAQWDFDAIGQWSDAATSDQHVAWVRGLWTRFEPHLLGKAYVNHLAADDRPETIRASYGENYTRLRQAKAIYDPTNLFRMNANIPPA